MKKVKSRLFISVLIISLLMNSILVYASGDGIPFSNGTKPLSFVSCTLEDGTKIEKGEEVSILQPKFTLLFDKNVVNMLVWENNRKCITMHSDNNISVLVDVTKIDDTVDFDHRQQIFVQPTNPLEWGKIYYINISPNLKAKNENSVLSDTTNGEGITIVFKTKNQVVQSSTSQPAASSQNIPVTQEQPKPTNSPSQGTQNNNQQNISNNETKVVTSEAPTNNSNVKIVEKKAEDVAEKKSNDVAEKKADKNTISKNTALASSGTSSNYILEIAVSIIVVLWILFEFFVWRKNRERKKY
ncbi:MAG: hypothetical protein Q8936_17025 [Bacillota bacterium]|nr:hypothetical protein [Bacillota bacterium]